jgi:effector-binding domain-containing protein
MPEPELEFGVPTATPVAADGRVLAGVRPAGRYATVSYWGGYENLMDVNAVLIGWAREKSLKWDAVEAPAGDRYASRLEIYETDPKQEPDPARWKTEVAIKLG